MGDRFHADLAGAGSGQVVTLNKEESHHLLTVMRARPGSELRVFGDGREYAAVLDTAEGGHAHVRLVSEIEPVRPPHIALTIAMPLLKGGGTEWAAEKLTELGVAGFVIYGARRSVVEDKGSKFGRFLKVVLGAAKQCGRADIPRIQPAANLKSAAAIGAKAGGLCLLAAERIEAPRLSSAIATARLESDKPLENVFLATGPEGGFDEAELESVRDSLTFVSLGPRILRAETAPVAAAAAILCAGGDL